MMEKLKKFYVDDISEEDLMESIDDDIIATGYRIMNIRKLRGMTQKQLAERSGISAVTIIKIENGTHKNVTFQQLKRISVALSVPLSKIIGLEFYVEETEDINRFLLYYPLLRKDLLNDIIDAVFMVNGGSDIEYIKKRLNYLYSLFPRKTRAFLEVMLLQNTVGLSSPTGKIDFVNYEIPEPYNEILTKEEFEEYEEKYEEVRKERAKFLRIISDSASNYFKWGDEIIKDDNE